MTDKQLVELKHRLKEAEISGDGDHVQHMISVGTIRAMVNEIEQPISDQTIRVALLYIKSLKLDAQYDFETAASVKDRIGREPENFTWRWEENGYYPLLYVESQQRIKMLELIQKALIAYHDK